MQGIALADQILILSLIDDGAHFTADVGGAVGTVVSDHVHVDQILRIGLPLYAFEQLGNHLFLVPCGDQNGIMLGLIGGRIGFRFFDARDEHVHELVGIQHGKQNADTDRNTEADGFERCHAVGRQHVPYVIQKVIHNPPSDACGIQKSNFIFRFFPHGIHCHLCGNKYQKGDERLYQPHQNGKYGTR